MPTLWTFESGASKIGSGATLTPALGANATPLPGDLMVTTARCHGTTGIIAGATIADTSTGGATWLPLAAFESIGNCGLQGWYKVANINDYNNGTGIGITVTFTGATGTLSAHIECDVFRVPPGCSVVGLDQSGHATNSASVSTASWNVSSVSTYQETDELSFSCLAMSSLTNGGITGTNVGVGHVSQNLTVCTATNEGFLANQYAGLVTPTGFVIGTGWENTWTTARTNSLQLGALFVYQSAGNLIPLLANA